MLEESGIISTAGEVDCSITPPNTQECHFPNTNNKNPTHELLNVIDETIRYAYPWMRTCKLTISNKKERKKKDDLRFTKT